MLSLLELSMGGAGLKTMKKLPSKQPLKTAKFVSKGTWIDIMTDPCLSAQRFEPHKGYIEDPGLAFRTPESARKSMQKLLGHNAALRGWSLQLRLRKIRRNGAKPPCQRGLAVLEFRRNAVELYAGSSKFAMVSLSVKLEFHFVRTFFRP